MVKILVTGCSGMIAFHLLKSLSQFKDYALFGIDKNISTFDNLTYSLERINFLENLNPEIQFSQLDLTAENSIERIIEINPDFIIHLAASAGIAESFKNPKSIFQNNQDSFLNILEAIRKFNLNTKLFYASSSSVYGKTLQEAVETNSSLAPTSSYGLSKLMNEQMASLYYQNYGISSIGLRFFTVYGEYNRKDMLMHYLLDSFQQNKEVKLYNNGLMQRDFTYVGDVVNSIIKMIQLSSTIQHEVFNIGGTGSATLNEVVDIMQSHYQKKPNIIRDDFIPVYDPLKTYCNNHKLLTQYPELNFTSLNEGLDKLVSWYKNYNKEVI